MRFAKLQGLGNDFILVDARGRGPSSLPAPEVATRLCDRHTGIGADGVLTLLDPAEGAGVRMVVHNADGSVPEMCGNGARCAALWIATEGCTKPGSGEVLLQTDAGLRPCSVEAARPGWGEIEVQMGVPDVQPARLLQLGEARIDANAVSLGNPHRVFFLGEAAQLPLGELVARAARHGPAVCAAENANIELVARVGRQRYLAAVWERGAGVTQACGTGACAIGAAAIARGYADPKAPLTVDLPGGALTLRFDAGTGEARMRGPAQLVYRGELA